MVDGIRGKEKTYHSRGGDPSHQGEERKKKEQRLRKKGQEEVKPLQGGGIRLSTRGELKGQITRGEGPEENCEDELSKKKDLSIAAVMKEFELLSGKDENTISGKCERS